MKKDSAFRSTVDMERDMSRQHLIRRLLYLRNWEFANILILPACIYITLTSFNVQEWQPYAFSVMALCLILAQGAFYWHLKLQVIQENTTALPSYFHQTFSLFRRVNVLLMAIYPALVIGNHMTTFIHFQTSIWSNALFMFVLLEHINYYHYQLSHDNLNDIRYLMKHKKIRRSPLWIDLQRSRGKAGKHSREHAGETGSISAGNPDLNQETFLQGKQINNE